MVDFAVLGRQARQLDLMLLALASIAALLILLFIVVFRLNAVDLTHKVTLT